MAAKVKDLMDALKGPVRSELMRREGKRVKPVRSPEDQPMSKIFENEDSATLEKLNENE